MKESEIRQINTTALAFMGDAAYEVYVRERLMETKIPQVKKLHKKCVVYVKAENQAVAITQMFDELTEDEQFLVKRARNRQVATKAKNASLMAYKWATAFEALIGFHYLAGNTNRMNEIILKAMNIIDENGDVTAKNHKSIKKMEVANE